MITQIVKTERHGKSYVLFNKRGMVLELSGNEYKTFKKFANQKKFPEKHRKFFNKLCYYEMVEFDGYEPKKVPVEYSKKLLHHDSGNPVFRAPIVAHLGITSKCNMRCKYCSVRESYSKTKELTTGEWKKIIKKLGAFGAFQIGFTGGEPTLRKDLVELARCVIESNSTFNLTTNGWNVDEDMIKELKKTGMRQCQVSLDCHIPEVNDKLRSRGSCERVIETIRLLKKHDVTVGIDCVVSKNNLRYISDFINWLSGENIPFLTLIKIKKGDLNLEDFKKLLPSYMEYSLLIEKLCNRENVNPCVTLDCGSVSNLQYTLKNQELGKVPVAGCPVGHTLLSISPNGDIHPCVALSGQEFNLGNALTDDLNDIWKNSAILKELREVKKRVEGRCKDCNRLDYCRGGCRGIAYTLFNGLWDSDKTCMYGGEKIESLG